MDDGWGDGPLASGLLFDSNVGATNVHLSITYHSGNGITISGSDYGASPKAVFGSSENEYWRSVKPEYCDRVFFELLKESGAPHERFSPARLVELIIDRFGGTEHAERNFHNWCDDHGIPTEFFSWVSAF